MQHGLQPTQIRSSGIGFFRGSAREKGRGTDRGTGPTQVRVVASECEERSSKVNSDVEESATPFSNGMCTRMPIKVELRKTKKKHSVTRKEGSVDRWE